MLFRQGLLPAKSGFLSSTPILKKPTASRYSADNQSQMGNQQEDDLLNSSTGQIRKCGENSTRKIKRSVVNRSCINVTSYSCRALPQVPPDLLRNSQYKLARIQKLDLSFNNIWDIRSICFEQMTSLKELLLNDNKISELPFAQINTCKSLRLINLNNNQLYIMPALTKITYLQAKSNPLNLVTAELVKLSNFQFFTFDWLDYLTDHQISQTQDKYRDYCLQYAAFKKQILEKIDYKNQHYSNFCDFHCYFSIRFKAKSKEDPGLNFISQLIVKAISKNCTFFLTYLKSFQAEINYPKLTYSNRLLLEVAFQSNNMEALQLFCLKKTNFTQDNNDQTYFQSLKICCRYTNYAMFRYLFQMNTPRKRIQTQNHLSMLIKQVFYKYSREKQSDRILFDLVRLYIDTAGLPVSINIPHQFNSRTFKSLSFAMLDIYQHKWFSNYFKMEFDRLKTTPLHFGVKSKNEELVKLLLQKKWDVFEKNEYGVACKFVSGGTQVSRKMIWRREKALLKKHFKNKAEIPISQIASKPVQEFRNSINKQVISLVGYTQFQQSFILYRPAKYPIKFKTENDSEGLILPHRRDPLKDQILSHLGVRARQFNAMNWAQHYLRKIINIDIITYLLHRLATLKQINLARRIQGWYKNIEFLIEIFDILGKQNPLMQFEVIQSFEGCNILRDNMFSNQIEIQTQDNSIGSDNFWCCRVVPT